jgi:UDP-glucose 4-epimerase
MRVLVTGGAGYIGSHTLISLIENGLEPIVIDNLSNSSLENIDAVRVITGKPVIFHELDARDTQEVVSLLLDKPCEAVIHFAGLKAVGESVDDPISYYKNNLESTISVCEAVAKTSTEHKPPRIIFSSSATVYGQPQYLPLTEEHSTGVNISNPYGWTKFMGEQILKDFCSANPKAQAICLRYFNPIGAHSSCLIGESPRGKPNNLAPYILKVASGELSYLPIFGADYDTPDGTGIRDYIDVMDLSEGHVKALDFAQPGFHAFNLATGKGTSVLDLVRAFEEVTKVPIPHEFKPRRPGDVEATYS